MTDIIEAVVGVCTYSRTGMVLADEFHNISLTSGAEVADTLQYFAERLATFVYTGVDISESGLLSGTRGTQMAGRFTLTPSRPFPCNSEWKAWSPPWRTPCGCTTTAPAHSQAWTASCTTTPAA
ncbi:hypothetical protein ACWC98_12045 [Streptomyces goshikiensis]